MSDENPNEPTGEDKPIRSALTPEQRRFLGTPRTRRQKDDERSSPETSPSAREEAPQSAPAEPVTPAPVSQPAPSAERPRPAAAPETEREVRKPAPPITTASDATGSRASEMQNVILIIGVVILLGLAFFVGKKFDYWKYKIFTKSKPTMEAAADKFPGQTSDQLVEQGLALERQGKFAEAADHFMEAKRKDLTYRGLLFHVAKIAYDHRDLKAADNMFERSIEFGENADMANCFRGLIAVSKKDFPAARRYFAAAAAADPFMPYFQFCLGDVDRLDAKPKDAIAHYQQAERRARGEPEAAVYRFKTRVARLEAGEGEQLKAELAKAAQAGSLSGDWLFTRAAIQVHDGKIQDAIATLAEARSMTNRMVFGSCATDLIFQDAASKNPSLAETLRGEVEGLQPFSP